MGCFGRRSKPEFVLAEHKFAYINMSEFRSKSWMNYTAYGWIYVGTIISIACYAADLYTAIIMLAYNRWTNDTLEKSAIIDFTVAKIIFCVCIFISFALLAVDWFFAIKVIKSDGVAEAYMNPIAVSYNCIRGGHGKEDTGWRRFLVFAKLTEARGILDYLALFTYFSFKGWVRIIFAEGPRVVINALTFISVTQADVIIQHDSGQWDGWEKFGANVEALWNQNEMQVLSLGTMAFTSLIWILSILRIFAASVIYILYLWHTISGDQNLQKYCKDRIDKRMGEIVQKKHDKALKREKKENKEKLERQPTIPVLIDDQPTRKPTRLKTEDSMDSTAHLLSNAHSIAESTYSPLSREPTLPNIAEAVGNIRPPPPARSATNATTRSNASSSGSRGYPPPYVDTRVPPQRQQAYGGGEVFDSPSSYGSPALGGSGGEEYPLQPLPAPQNSGRPPFVADRLARSNTGGNGWDNGPQPQGGRWGPAPPPGPRSQTAGPQMYGQPPLRSQTFGPQGNVPLPPRSQTAGPQMRAGYGAPMPQGGRPMDGPPPVRRGSETGGGGYRSPPPRNNTAPPMEVGYGQDGYGTGYGAPLARSQTGPTQMDDVYGNDGYRAPVRRGSEETGGYGYGTPLARSQTAAPMDRYGSPAPPPMARVLMDGRYGTPPPRSQTGTPGYGPPPRSLTPGNNTGYGPPERTMTPGNTGYDRGYGPTQRTMTPSNAAYGPPPRSLTPGNGIYGVAPPSEPVRIASPPSAAYAKAKYQPAPRAQELSAEQEPEQEPEQEQERPSTPEQERPSTPEEHPSTPEQPRTTPASPQREPSTPETPEEESQPTTPQQALSPPARGSTSASVTPPTPPVRLRESLEEFGLPRRVMTLPPPAEEQEEMPALTRSATTPPLDKGREF